MSIPRNTNVTKMTTNVIKMIRFLIGNSACEFIITGIDKAVARETTPLIPAQPMIKGFFHPGLGSRRVFFTEPPWKVSYGIDP